MYLHKLFKSWQSSRTGEPFVPNDLHVRGHQTTRGNEEGRDEEAEINACQAPGRHQD